MNVKRMQKFGHEKGLAISSQAWFNLTNYIFRIHDLAFRKKSDHWIFLGIFLAGRKG